MLTGHDEITDRVKALDAGVDDYLIKPFSIDELMARLRAMHRRAETFSSPVGGSDVNEILKVADLSMNTRTRDVMRGDRAIRLSVKEYDLLNFLMRGAGRVLERQEIMHGVWGENFMGTTIFSTSISATCVKKSNWTMRQPLSTPCAVSDSSSGNNRTAVSVSLGVASALG